MKVHVVRKILLVLFLMSSLFVVALNGKDTGMGKITPAPVDSVDLKKYTGVWYEIARIPNRFQKKCGWNVTATYYLRNDGRLDVINRCITPEGQPIDAVGIAQVINTRSNAELKVSFVSIFGKNIFWGDYWIIGLADDYRYAVIGHPKRKYGWILCRTPEISSEDMMDIREILKQQGYNPDDFEPTEYKSK